MAAPRIAAVFTRRLAATNNLCMLATLRADGFPRISPVEPRIFEHQLVVMGMPGTRKFADLVRDPRLCLHTATVDTNVDDGDAKIFGTVADSADPDLHRRFAEALFVESGFDIRGQTFEHYFTVDIAGASAVEVSDGHLDITIWRLDAPEHVVRKH